jgi:hypothetical protein
MRDFFSEFHVYDVVLSSELAGISIRENIVSLEIVSSTVKGSTSS